MQLNPEQQMQVGELAGQAMQTSLAQQVGNYAVTVANLSAELTQARAMLQIAEQQIAERDEQIKALKPKAAAKPEPEQTESKE